MGVVAGGLEGGLEGGMEGGLKVWLEAVYIYNENIDKAKLMIKQN